ncbi:D-alanine--D-alanine ligase [Leptospira congkakensis]|uniref:D-alanine--D-alanine ligase n=1 Tax=Leptospira congkakensis TaxID=2484932 RepID=A0A4Z1A6T9_9LEPT|nr:D-alanine--D-alanine ligase [Leptospira congkakensis]TGL90373.1 D-alanine--D-alanine ligase [Leptospira congkakensis]TGL91380.1 D-alanine--D-alanine ligase [Leptospira congkakensis]TGL98432.1 D-alanine--D-alanine ligase [Leptospira congkakensis]
MIQTKIALLFGGISGEHIISIRSSHFIFNTIDREKYQVCPVYIDQTGKFWIADGKDPIYPDPTGKTESDFLTEFSTTNQITKSTSGAGLLEHGFSAAFLGLHGGPGEDGRIQGFLDTLGIPHTGSGVLASALAMDKYRANLLFQTMGIPVAPFVDLEKGKSDARKIVLNLPFEFPVFIKPTLGGSSVNTGMAKTPEEAMLLVDKIFVSEDRVLIQKLISGTEVSIGVLEKKEGEKRIPFALVPTEIRPKSEFFDFEAKYTKGGSEEITPAPVGDAITKKLQEYTLVCHEVLGCKGYSRTDFIISDGVPYVLETNTLPGMTGTSLIPQQAKALGIEMKEVFTWLLRIALS